MLKKELQTRLNAIARLVNDKGGRLQFSFSKFGYDPLEFEDCNNLCINFEKKRTDIALDKPIESDADWYYYVLMTLRGMDSSREFVTLVQIYNDELPKPVK